MSLYEVTVPQFVKMLRNLERWLDKGVAFAKAKSFEPQVLLTSRLAPDQFALMRQVQSACESAKSIAAQLVGKEPPAQPDNDQTVEDLKKRIDAVIAYLGTLRAADFAGAEERVIPLSFMPGKGLGGRDFLYQLGLPNFYFHVTTAYSILRHLGVDVGKADFIGELPLRAV
jgi:hypothetical protein